MPPIKTTMRAHDGSIIKFECHDELESTVKLAREYAKMGYPDRYVVFSERKTVTSATGKRLSPGQSERGVYFSCILRPSIFLSQAGFIGAMSALSLISALEEHTTKRLGIGWIGDIFCEGKYIGSSSTEGMLDSFSAYQYIIVTVSVKLSEADFPPRLTDLVKKVFESENTSVSMIVAKNILSKFLMLYPKRLKSPEKFMDLYKRKFILSGKRIVYIEGGKRRICKVLTVDSTNGTLVVETRGGRIKHIAMQRSVVMPKRVKLKK